MGDILKFPPLKIRGGWGSYEQMPVALEKMPLICYSLFIKLYCGFNRGVAQLVARSVRDAEAPGSSPGSPTEIYGVKDLAEGSIAPLVTCESNLEQQSEVSRYEIPEFHIPSAPTNYLILIE